jgi:hypothetical protein
VRESTVYTSEILNNELKRKDGERAVLAIFMVHSRNLPGGTVESQAKL